MNEMMLIFEEKNWILRQKKTLRTLRKIMMMTWTENNEWMYREIDINLRFFSIPLSPTGDIFWFFLFYVPNFFFDFYCDPHQNVYRIKAIFFRYSRIKSTENFLIFEQSRTKLVWFGENKIASIMEPIKRNFLREDWSR